MPARHESLQGDLLAKSNIGSDSSGRRKRVSARHQVKRLDRDLEKPVLFAEAVRQKKSVFFVRCGSAVRNFTGLYSPE
jgi:hypothetical protein